MVHNVQMLCLFVVIIVVIYSSYSYAPAEPLWDGPSQNMPASNETRSCREWLQFEGLTANSVDGEEGNMARSMARDKNFDQGKHVWAACYAYFISSFSESNPEHWSIDGYCHKVNPENVMTPFLSLQNSMMTCAGWLSAYGYHERHEDNSENAQMAFSRVRKNDKDPHFLVAMYSEYIENRLKEKKILDLNELDYTRLYTAADFSVLATPPQFCILLENNKPGEPAQMKPFATLETLKFCQEWIVLAGYSAVDVQNNVYKALREGEKFLIYHSRWTIEYIKYLIDFRSRFATPTPDQFCILKGYIHPVYYKRPYNNNIIIINQ